MKYAPTICDFENGFFLIDRAREPYFLISAAGQVLRSNKVGQRYLKAIKRAQPQVIDSLRELLKNSLNTSGGKAVTQLLGDNRKRVLRAVPVGSGQGFIVEIDRI